jgi:hypothetical protein
MPADVCGPFTLEQLDLFGDIDTIPFSLDSEIWESADTCVLYQEGQISAQGDVDVEYTRTRPGAGDISADGTVTGSVTRERFVAGEVNATGDVDAVVVRIREFSGAISATGDVTAEVIRVLVAAGVITAQSEVAASVAVTRTVEGAISAEGNVSLLVFRFALLTGLYLLRVMLCRRRQVKTCCCWLYNSYWRG